MTKQYTREEITALLQTRNPDPWEYSSKLEEVCQQILSENEANEKKIKILEEGLEFYADSYTWVSNSGKVGINPIDHDTEIIPGTQGVTRYCGGKKARETLEKVRKA